MPVVVTTEGVSVTAFATGAVARMQAALIAPMTPSRKCCNCSLIRFPFLEPPISTAYCLCRSSIAGSFAYNARMTTISCARKRILQETLGSARPRGNEMG